MLSTIRNKATGLITYILIGAICLSFALWGISSYFEGAAEVDVASVNGDEIGYEAYQNQLRARQQQMRQLFQNGLPADYYESVSFKRQTLNQMIDRMLLNQITEDRRYTLSDKDLAERITTDEAFFTDGQFDEQRYRRLLASNNWTVQTFENAQRRQGAFVQLEQALANSFEIDDAELNDILKLTKQKRQANYILFNAADFQPEITPEEIQAQYDEFPDLYKTQERVKIDYVELSAESFKDDSALTDEELMAFYEENKADYSKPEARKASHILIKPEEDNEASEQAALEQAQALIEQISGGADFAELAKENSADKGSANNGGDLGVITPGVMVKPFEDAVFALTEGEVSEPVKSDFGYHIIKLTELTAEQIQPFAEVKEEIATTLKDNQAIEAFLNQAESFRNIAFESPDSLEPIADQLGLEINSSDWFTRATGAGVASAAEVRTMAFSDIVLNDDLNGDVVELGENRLIALRKSEYEPSQPKPLEEVRNQIVALLSAKESQQLAVDKGQEQLNLVSSNVLSWDDLIKTNDYVQEALPATRDEAGDVNVSQISKAVFEQPRPQEGQSIYGGVELNNGYAIYQLSDVIDIEDSELVEIDEQERTSLQDNLQQRFGAEVSGNILASLRAQADIRIFEENL